MKKILVIGYVWPEPKSSAAGAHIMSIMQRFIEEGYHVEFATPAQQTDHMINLQDYGISRKGIALNCDSFDQYLQAFNPDIVMFDRFMMEEQFGWRVDKYCPNALKILDTEDLQFLRHARHHAHKADRVVAQTDLSSDLAKREVAAILRCDLSLIISSYEMQLLTQNFNIDSSLLFHLPFMVDLNKLPKQTKCYEDRQHFMTIGNFRHAPNWDSVLYLQKIWPLIRARLPKAQLHIYGSYPPPKATALNNPKTGFLIKGWAEDAYDVMEQARVCLAPIRFGAGIKGKLLDAMIMRTPSVTTSIGGEGMFFEQIWPGTINDDIHDFVDSAIALYETPKTWQFASNAAHKLLHSNYNASTLGNSLIAAMVKCQNNLEQHRLNNFIGAMLKHHTMASTKYMSQWINAKNSK